MFVFLHRFQARSLSYDSTHTDHDDVRPHKSRGGKHLSPIPILCFKLVSLTRAPNPHLTRVMIVLWFTPHPPPHPPMEPQLPNSWRRVGLLVCIFFLFFPVFWSFRPIFLRGRHCSAVLHQCCPRPSSFQPPRQYRLCGKVIQGQKKGGFIICTRVLVPPPPFLSPEYPFPLDPIEG